MNPAWVYIVTNDRQTVLYTGSTNDLRKRIYCHRRRLVPGFTSRYNVYRLVYFEEQPDIGAARLRERQIKGMSRAKKDVLIANINREWRDLSENLGGPCDEVEARG